MTEALGSKITSRLGSICDSSLNCELSKLESLCEEVLEDQEDFISKDDLNSNQTSLRIKRDVSPQPIEITTTINSRTYSQNRNVKNENATTVLPKQSVPRTRISKPPKRKARWFSRRRRRRRRRSRIKLLFRMLGKEMKVLYTYYLSLTYLN